MYMSWIYLQCDRLELDWLAIFLPSTLKLSRSTKIVIYTWMSDHNQRLIVLLNEEKRFQTINSQLTYGYVTKSKLLYDENPLELWKKWETMMKSNNFSSQNEKWSKVLVKSWRWRWQTCKYLIFVVIYFRYFSLIDLEK